MVILNKAKRYRFDIATFDMLSQVRKYKGSESRFVRDAIREKLHRDLPLLIAEEKRKQGLNECPF